MTDAAPTSTSDEDQWDGPRLEAALAHFEKLQEQIDSLRTLLPSMVEPLRQPKLNKAEMFKRVKDAAVESTGDLKSFRETWSSEQTQDLFSRSRESYQKDGDLSKALNVPRYGWDEVRREGV